VVEEGVATFRRRATAAGADLDAEVDPDVWADLDEEAFTIVVSNLLENAVKYGGTIPSVRVRLAASDGRAVLEVSDNGRGIAADDLAFVFNRFYRGGDEMTRTTQGTGLGLYLVREIVTAHGGSVEVARTDSTGTTFRVTLDRVEVREETA
jgi:signal transduction histidine kinase